MRADALAQSEAQRLAQFAADNRYNQGPQPYDNDIDTNNELALVNLSKFGLLGKTSLTNALRGVYKKWLIDNYINSNKIDLITFIITCLRTGVANHLKQSIIIRLCHMSGVDQPDEYDIKEILDEIIHNWERMISEDRA